MFGSRQFLFLWLQREAELLIKLSIFLSPWGLSFSIHASDSVGLLSTPEFKSSLLFHTDG